MSKSPLRPFLRKTIPYGTKHSLQTLDITLPHPLSTPSTDKYIIIYIHGGAWRSPSQSSADFNPAIKLLYNHSKTAGLISINYGLSPSKGDPSSDASRQNFHPDHLGDVHTALELLRDDYNIGTKEGWKYILVGHSCGATMVYQITGGIGASLPSRFTGPEAVIGIEGIYDLYTLVQNHTDEAIYEDLVVGAFGHDHDDWHKASPSRYAQEYKQEDWYDEAIYGRLKLVKVLGIAYSNEDELVESQQADDFENGLQQSGLDNVLRIDLDGTHDGVWENGTGVARAIEAVLDKLE